MKFRIFILATVLFATYEVSGQRNRIHFVGLEYDNLLGRAQENIMSDNTLNRYNIQIGYERSFGSHVTIGLGFKYYFSFGDNLILGELREEYVKPGSGSNLVSISGVYNEQNRFGIIYECKYFTEEFSEEPEGGYISSFIMLNRINQSMNEYSVYDNLITSSRTYPGFENSYTIIRYGFKFGVQWRGNLYLGATYNFYVGDRTDYIKNQEDGYKVSIGSPVVDFNIIFGYNWGVNF